MRLGRNLLAGFTNSVWAALVGFAVVPIYLKYLGLDAYGLIGFFASMQALLQLLDFGLAPTINREVARCSANVNLRDARNLLHSLTFIYFGVAALIAIALIGLAPLVAKSWLRSTYIPVETITNAVMLMGFVAACRWPIGLYQGVLMGAQRITVLSGVNMAIVTLGSLGAVGVLAFFANTIEAFFIWQAFMAIVNLVCMRWFAWRAIGGAGEAVFDIDGIKRILRFTVGVSGITLSAVLLSQLDKVILSKLLSLDDFGQYILATTVVSGLYFLIMPIFNVIYPRFSALVASGDTKKLSDLYRQGTRLMAALLFPLAMVLVIFPDNLVHVWTGNLSLAIAVAPLIAIMAVGSALHGMMFFPYALQLAYGRTRLPLTINAILILIVVPLTYFLVLTHGVLGGAIAWLIFHLLYFLLGTWLTHRYLLKGIGLKWIIQDVGIPLMVTLIIGSAGAFFIIKAANSDLLNLCLGALLCILAMMIALVMTPQPKMILSWFSRASKVGMRNYGMVDAMYYSQFGEDKILYEIFGRKSTGLCIEIGANDGVTDSTTYFFEKIGWDCILIEPNPDLCSHIRQMRNALLFECAASNRAGNAILYVAEGTERSHGVSTICSDKKSQDRIASYGFTARPVEVVTRTLDSVLDESKIFSMIDFISIDVEGHELDVLKGFSIGKWMPKVIVVEDNSNFKDKEVTNYLKNFGYVPFMRTGVNNWFAHKNNKNLVSMKNRVVYNCRNIIKNCIGLKK